MEENKNFVEVKSSESKTSKNTSNSFGKNVFVPFISGILGAGLVLGVGFNVPYVKNTLLGINNSSTSSSQTIDYNNVNTNLVSLSSFSDTGVYVAQRVLPSIVGIKVLVLLLVMMVIF